MEFKFDAHQQYQKDAISSIVDLFEGQPQDAASLQINLSASLVGSGNQEALDITPLESITSIKFDTTFNFLIVSQLTSLEESGDRKNIFNTIRWFCETFENEDRTRNASEHDEHESKPCRERRRCMCDKYVSEI